MNETPYLHPAPREYTWPLCPEADAFLREQVEAFLDGHAFAADLASKMHEQTSTIFFDWVDHVVLPASRFSTSELGSLGFARDERAEGLCPPDSEAWWHPHAQLPRLVLQDRRDAVDCAIKVDSITDFLTAHALCHEIKGAPFSTYRQTIVPADGSRLLAVERRGTRGYVPTEQPVAGDYLRVLETWTNRQRGFDDEVDGIRRTLELARRLAGEVGQDTAAWIFLETERRIWQARNDAGRLQKWRQDRLGLGWANHDHHTFRSSRRHFAGLIDILLAFGFKKRERYYAGAEAGWGAQIMEQPEAGLVVFADVDLMPAETDVDFSAEPLEPLDQPGTVGLWCALHGDSILQAGMHHLEAQFDFNHLRDALGGQGVETMAPFSDFPYLRQAFTRGQTWPVDPARLGPLFERGAISPEAQARF
ncbi:MAG: hypothetical protein OER86_05900, partial [Phycisphaerae bacterium]|nr:hypothetical protein [Phycisphaerae bacterium]